ncbi:MAG: glutamate--tRNA ligase family protein, partial [Clostridia bacterium]
MEARNFIEEYINADIESGKIETTTTRFPPEPNGYLHIGHAKSLCINFGIKEKYHGKCNLRFDDTNPTKEDVEYVDAIKQDIKWLGFSWDRETYASDFFEELYQKAIILIKKGLAYVCEYTADEIKATRGTLTEGGKESPWRNRSIEENLDLFERMKNGEFANGQKVLRAKIDMSSPNI